MKKNLTINILGLLFLTFTFSACNHWEAPEFNAPVYDGPAANHTIADIKAMHPTLASGAQDSITSWDEPFIVKAVVVSSDQGGNCYKYLTIQDETGGIEISIDRSGIYNDYPVGQTIYLDCRGLIVGDYHNKYQIGWKYSGSVGRINANALDRYLHKDGVPDLTNPIIANPIEVTGANELNAENVNCLVKLSDCTFDSKYDGQQLADNDFTMDREVYVNGQSITVRTSNYANFRNIVIDASRHYCLYGILTVYNSEYQLALRTKEDVQFATVTENVLLKELTFNSSSFTSGGWSQSPNNDAWKYQTMGGNEFVYHNTSSTTCDDWLISPEINISDLSNVIMYLDHQNTVAGSLADYYQVYYSTTYNGGTFNESDWTAFNPNVNYFPSSFDLSNALDASVIGSSNFRIALRYHKSGSPDGTRWAVRGIKFYQPVEVPGK